MLGIVTQIDAFDPVAATLVSLRAGSHDDARICVMDGPTWWPAITKLPSFAYDLFDGAFDGQITSPSTSFSLATEAWPAFGRYQIADARTRIWTGEVGAPFADWVLRFDGRAASQPKTRDGMADIEITVDDAWLDTPLLATYAGTGGIEGGPDLKGQCKPLAIGAPRYASGVLIDVMNSVFQVSAYGPVNGWVAALERLARFSAPVANYGSYDALVAAEIPPGRWATCRAQGLVRFGAPPAGLITFILQGDAAGPDGWVRRPGEIIRRLALLSGGAGRIDDASLDALDAARSWNLSRQIGEQTTARDLIQAIAGSVNAVAGVSWLGKLFVAPIELSAPSITLHADGSSLPPVASVSQANMGAPWWRLAIDAERTETVHGLGDIAFTAALNPRGAWSVATTYREGDIVTQPNGSQYLYINPAASAGNPLPAPPATKTAWWEQLLPAISAEWDKVEGVNKPADNATNSADPDSPFGPTETIAEAKARISSAIDDAVTAGQADVNAARGEIAAAKTALGVDIADAKAEGTLARNDLLAEVSRAKGAEGTLTTTIADVKQTAEGAATAVTDEIINRTTATNALAARTTTVEARLVSRPNMLPNGGFELGLDKWALSTAANLWTVVASSPWGTYLAANAPGLLPATGTVTSDPFTVYPGNLYTLSGESDVQAAGGYTYFDLLFLDAQGNLALDGGEKVLPAPHGFTTNGSNRAAHTISVMAPANAVQARARAVWQDISGATGLAFRQIKVELGGLPATAYSTEGVIKSLDAFIREESVARVRDDGAIALRTLALEASLNTPTSGVIARAAAEELVRATADSALATRATSLEASGGRSGNLLSNTDFAVDTSGWGSVADTNVTYGRDMLGDAYRPTPEHVIACRQVGDENRYPQWFSEHFAVEASTWIECSAWLAAARAPAQIFLQVFRADGTTTNIAFTGFVDVGHNTTSSLLAYRRLWAKGLLPANAVKARFVFEKAPTYAGQGDSYAWMARPYAGKATATQTEPSSYSPGSAGLAIVNTNARIGEEALARSDADGALATRALALETTVNTPTTGLTARVSAEETARSDADAALATRASTLEARSGPGGNLLQNTDFAFGFEGWTFGGNRTVGSWTGGRDPVGDGWRPIPEHNLGMYSSGDAGAGLNIYGDWVSEAFAVRPSTVHSCFVHAAAHRCSVQLHLVFQDASGNVLAAPNDTRAVASGGNALGLYTQMQILVYSPATAARAYVVMRKMATQAGQSDSYAWFARPYVGEGQPGQITPNAYSPGSSAQTINRTRALISDEATARATALGAVAERTTNLETGLSTLNTNVNARIGDEETARATAVGAVAQRTSYIEARTSNSFPNLIANGDFKDKGRNWVNMGDTPTPYSNWLGSYASLSGGPERYVFQDIEASPGVPYSLSLEGQTNCGGFAYGQWLNAARDTVIVTMPSVGFGLENYPRRGNDPMACPSGAAYLRIIAVKPNSGGDGYFNFTRVQVQNGVWTNWRDDASSRQVLARINDVEFVSSEATQAVARRTSTLETSVGGLSSSVTTQAGSISDLQGRNGAYLTQTVVAGSNRAQISIFADANGGAGVDIVGDLSLSGDLLLGGSIFASRFALNQTMIPARASAENYITGKYASLSGVAEPREPTLTIIAMMTEPGWIEVTAKIQQGFQGDAPWRMALSVNGIVLNESLSGGSRLQDTVATQGAYYAASAGNYTIVLEWAANSNVTLRERSMFVKMFPRTQ